MSRVPWRDPDADFTVKVALMSLPPERITLLECPQCLNWSVYNNGPSFACTAEGCGWHCSEERLTALLQEGNRTNLARFRQAAEGLRNEHRKRVE